VVFTTATAWSARRFDLGRHRAEDHTPPQPEPVPNLPIAADSTVIRAIVESGRHPELEPRDFADVAPAVDLLYRQSEFQPLWIVGDRPAPIVAEAVAALAHAAEYGLPPEIYPAARLASELAVLRQPPVAGASRPARGDAPGGPAEIVAIGERVDRPAALARFDTAVTVSLLRFLSDVGYGRGRPVHLRELEPPDERARELSAVVERMRIDGRIIYEIAAFEPRTAQYVLLKQALAQYRQLAASVGFATLPFKTPVKPGQTYSGAAELRRLLVAVGDMHPSDLQMVSDVYALPLVAAVRRFQARHGLAADGIIGRETLAQLTTPLGWRARQIELSMERYRWAPAPAEGPYILINVPAFNLTAYHSPLTAGPPDLEMDIIVGQAVEKHQTPVFAAKMKYVVFRPYWNVPYQIATRELIPQIRRDARYIDEQHLEIVERYNDQSALPVSDENIARVARGSLRLRQRPGPDNALGLAKFLFPNPYDVYLHSTPSRSLFARRRRDFSHGCMRVENPQGLAEFVLDGDPAWTPAKIRAAMLTGEDGRWVRTPGAIPVLVLYATAGIEPDGTVLFFDDIYGRDAALDESLAASDSRASD